jgi:hypothetical protein
MQGVCDMATLISRNTTKDTIRNFVMDLLNEYFEIVENNYPLPSYWGGLRNATMKDMQELYRMVDMGEYLEEEPYQVLLYSLIDGKAMNLVQEFNDSSKDVIFSIEEWYIYVEATKLYCSEYLSGM